MPRILIADDDEDFSGAIAEVLRAAGYDAVREHNGAEVVRRVQEESFDALLLDVMFPENPREGLEIARAVRRAQPTLPVLLLTAVNQQSPLGFGSDEGDLDPRAIIEFLEKPVDFEILLDQVRRVLAR